MTEVFFTTLTSNAMALVQVLLIALTGAILVRTHIFKSGDIKGLTLIVVNVLLPAMIFSKIVATLDPVTFPLWWVLPLVGIGLILIGVIFAMLLFARDLSAKRSLIPLASMQNAGYLALPLGQAIYPEQFDHYALYTFLIIMGLNPILWSVGKFLNTGGHEMQFSWKQFITPPFIANLAGITFVISGLHHYIPKIVYNAIELTGTATIPIANFILGAVLGGISLKKWPSFMDTLRVVGVKFLIIPLVTIFAMMFFQIKETNPLLSDVILIQAVSPPAIAILIQIKNYGGDAQKSGSMMLISYIACIAAIPIWMAVWKVM
ncbi:MAG: AEC family transporter [Mariniphaga sp.]